MENLINQVSTEKADPGMAIGGITPGSAVTGPDSQKKADVPSVVQSTLDRFPKRKFQLTFNARYDTVIYLLDKLGNLALDRLVTVDHISLSPSGDTAKVRDVELNVALPLTAYLKTTGGQ
jgi:hypothetical protein